MGTTFPEVMFDCPYRVKTEPIGEGDLLHRFAVRPLLGRPLTGGM